MKTVTLILISISGAVFVAGIPPATAAPSAYPPANASIALVSKVVLDVKRKELEKDWEIAKRGETLSSGDRVRTGEKSIAIIKFKDNSLVRVRERSELTVTGETRGSSFSKNVNIEGGVVGFNIRKQKKDEEFRFTSPTSVASIRGTGGLFRAHESADTLTVVEGSVLLTNNISTNSVLVRAGFTGISNPDGTIQTRPATNEELAAAQNASSLSEQDNKLEIELRDNQGDRKELKIDFQE